jgi:hypothetical protein
MSVIELAPRLPVPLACLHRIAQCLQIKPLDKRQYRPHRMIARHQIADRRRMPAS